MQAIRGFLDSLHFGTRFLLIFMTLIYIIQITLFDDTINGLLALRPRKVIESGQVWRLVTSMFCHLGIFHLFSNMYSFSFLGMTLETTTGTMSFFYHIVVFGVLSNLVSVGIAYFMKLGGDSSAVNGGAMGFSGVLFALIVIDVHLSGGASRSVLGLFTVPSSLYPWIMLVVMSLLIPNVSFMGHFSGLVVGYLYKFKLLSWLAPSTQFFARMERRCRCVGRLGYVSAEHVHDATNFQPYAVFQHVYRDTPSDETPPNQGFQGTARTIGDVQPTTVVLDQAQEPVEGSDDVVVHLDEEDTNEVV